MNHLNRLRPLLLVALFAFNIFNQAQAQTHTPKYVSMGPNTNGYWEYLPQGYNPATVETYPVIIYIHGMGELGSGGPSGLGSILFNGVPRVISQGLFPTSFTLNGQSHKFIVISPQFIGWPSQGDVEAVINYVASHYKVDLTRIYMTGLSMGGGVVWEYAGGTDAQANRIAAIVPMCGASWPEYNRARRLANANVAVWATHNNGDPTVPLFYSVDYVNYINQAPTPNPPAKITIFQANHHDSWSRVYDPSYTENGLNMYQWMLQYKKGFAPPPVNQAPNANAGADQIMSVYSTNLNGFANDPDGSVVSTSWSKVSGPAQFTIANPNSLYTSISNLVQGSYTFRLTVVDNKGATSVDDINIIIPPVLPAKVQAEDWTAMSNVQTEGTQDEGWGLDVGWIDLNDWMEYYVSAPVAGNYVLKLRVATSNTGAQVQVRTSTGAVLSTVTIPNTGSYQAWQTVTTTVNLPQGVQVLRFVSTLPLGWNFNWFELTSGSSTPNQLPTVNAGTDQSITLPVSAVTLAGSATDADGSIASYLWTKLSGGTANFSAPSAAQTSVSGLQQGSYTFRLTATDNLGGVKSDDVIVTVNPAPVVVNYAPLPGKVEAEAYSAQSGIQTEPTYDAGGGQNVGWINQGDWMDYPVNVATAGTYTVTFRIATEATNAQFDLRKADGTVLQTVAVPNTFGYQTWRTITSTVALSAGQQTLRLYSSGAGGFNINWMEFAAASTTPTPTPTPPASSTTKVEAEAYINMSGVQTETTYDAGGGQNVGWINLGDWMDYTLSPAAAGTYTVTFRIATEAPDAQLQLRKADGTVLQTVTVPNTFGYQTWRTITSTVALSAGPQTIRLYSSAAGGFNINWMEFAFGASTTPPPPPPAPSVTTKVEAEAFTAQSGVQTEPTYDAGGGQNVGWINLGDWMDYALNLPATASYTLNLRIATEAPDAQLQLRKADGTVLQTITVPNTFGYQTWRTITTTVSLSAGQQTLRLYSSGAGGVNVNWMEFISSSSAPAPAPGGGGTATPTPFKVEAEAFTAQSGVQTEPTYDAGGGQNVGWINLGDWMDYAINPTGAATYLVSFRIATEAPDAQFQLRKADGTVLQTITVPNTFGYQTWRTITATVALSAGQQTLRLYSSAAGGFNVNWMEFVPQTTATTAAKSVGAAEVEGENGEALLSVFPQAIEERFMVATTTTLTGKMTVQLVDDKGTVVKTYTLVKATEGPFQSYLSAKGVAKGNYSLRLSIGSLSETLTVSKK